MKYCLSSNCSNQYLEKTDQIKTSYKNKTSLFSLIEKFPNKTIIVKHNNNGEEVFKDYKDLYILSKYNIIIELNSLYDYIYCQQYELPFYFTYQVSTMYELNMIKKYKPCYINIAAPLFFQMDLLKDKCDIPIRVIATDPVQNDFLADDYVNGRWIRPEDQGLYEDYIDVIDLSNETSVKKEQALFRIYAEDKKWNGDLGMIISNLNYIGENAFIELGNSRLNCGQRCAEDKSCRLCYRILTISASEALKKYYENKNNI